MHRIGIIGVLKNSSACPNGHAERFRVVEPNEARHRSGAHGGEVIGS